MAKKSKFGSTYKFIVVALMLASAFVGVDLVQRRQDLRSSASENINNTVSLNANPTRNLPGGREVVTWYSVNPLPQGWIGLYNVNSPNSNSILRKNLTQCNLSKESWGAGTRAGECTFDMPQTTGVYEFRIFKGSTKLATSNQVLVSTATPTPTVHVSIYPTRSVSVTPAPTITCYPPPPCLYTEPRCYFTEMPIWCPEF